MSIEVAYRLKKGHDVWHALADIRAKGMTAVRTELAGIYESWANNETFLASMIEEVGTPPVPSMTPDIVNLICSLYAQKQYLKAIEMKTRQMNLSVSITVRKLNNRYYLIPHCGGLLAKSLDYLASDRKLEEFGYWHCEGTPEGITPQAWVGRRKVWERLLDMEGGYWSKANQQLQIDICSPEFFDDVDPFMIKEVEA